MNTIWKIFQISTLIAIIFITIDNVAMSHFMWPLGWSNVISVVWLKWEYWLLLIILTVSSFRKDGLVFIFLLLITPKIILFFYGVFFVSQSAQTLEWICNEIAAVFSLLMLILGFTYYIGSAYHKHKPIK